MELTDKTQGCRRRSYFASGETKRPFAAAVVEDFASPFARDLVAKQSWSGSQGDDLAFRMPKEWEAYGRESGCGTSVRAFDREHAFRRVAKVRRKREGLTHPQISLKVEMIEADPIRGNLAAGIAGLAIHLIGHRGKPEINGLLDRRLAFEGQERDSKEKKEKTGDEKRSLLHPCEPYSSLSIQRV